MVFEDPSRARWRSAQLVAGVLGLFALLLLVDVVASFVVSPPLPAVGANLRSHFGQMDIVDAPSPATRSAVPAHASNAVVAPLEQRPYLRTAFMVQDDPRSVSSLRNHLNQLDIVFPDWLSCPKEDGAVEAVANPETQQLLTGSRVMVFPRLANVDASGWQSEMTSRLLRDEEASSALVENVVRALEKVQARGLNVDFESLEAADRERFLDFLQALAQALHRNRMYLSVDVPLNDEAFDYEMIGQIADFVVVMGYDEHFPGGSPGAIASMPWFIDGMENLAERIDRKKLIAALGAYAYDWKLKSGQPAVSMGFSEAMVLAGDTGVEIETDKDAINSFFRYKDEQGADHEVWLLDAVSAWNQWLSVREKGFRGLSLWRLGMEEPAVWGILSPEAAHPFDPATLATIRGSAGVCLQGEGEVLRVRAVPQDGKRNLSFDGKSIDYAAYEALPTSYDVQRLGHAAGKQVALTFDDGPDPTWTPQVLKTLEANHIQGTFFMVGQQIQQNADMVARVWKGGHLIGSHTFFHPNISTIPDARLRMELNVTQRLIESITGRETLLFRPPYDADTSPSTPEQLQPLYSVSQMGYLVAGADIDSEDYLRPGADQIVKNVVEGLETKKANIVVFHDAGGDRQQTVEALTRLIPLLKAQGYQFVTVDNLLGLQRDAVMPTIGIKERVILQGEGLWTWMQTTGWRILLVLFFVTTAVAIGRIVFLGFLVLRGKKACRPDAMFTPPVTVLIPAYNEGKVIRRTIESVLQSDYPNLSVLVIDDGSTDDTAAIVERMSLEDPRIGVITKPNGGKSSALNVGFETATDDYIVMIDGDTIIHRDTVSHLVAPFADPSVDAVCGNVQVGNVSSLLTAFQDVEYVTSQNYDRRAFETLNCISVVPGATGAWKRAVVLAAGGYSDDTLTEDADLTLTLLRAGAKIVYSPLARSVTEAPESTRTLFKQRFRWSFGTFQCLWKHRKAFGKGTLGWVAMPNMLVFQIIFPLLSPIGDLVLLASILQGQVRPVLAGYLMFLAMDLAGSAIAFALDGRELTGIWTVLVQRFYYRQFMYVVAIRSMVAAIRGGRHGWNKLQRQGTVSVVASASPHVANTSTGCGTA